jgi:hypothetical protein
MNENCWKGYKQVGMKKKGNKMVPNCVPETNENFDEMPGPIEGLEGPFKFRSGKILYYDPKEGKYYDRGTDMYVSDEEMMAHNNPRQSIFSATETDYSFANYMQLRESKENKKKKKPYKGFDDDKNHPEGGLKPSYAKKLGIHAGIETKREAERKGGVKKMSKKTQARRKSFCARMSGMKKKLTSKKVANDPNSKINAALRVWKC